MLQVDGTHASSKLLVSSDAPSIATPSSASFGGHEQNHADLRRRAGWLYFHSQILDLFAVHEQRTVALELAGNPQNAAKEIAAESPPQLIDDVGQRGTPGEDKTEPIAGAPAPTACRTA
jgi:hypothetical protein